MDLIETWTTPDRILAAIQSARLWLLANVVTPATLAQIAAVAVALLLARIVARPARNWIDQRLIRRVGSRRVRQVVQACLLLTLPVLWLLMDWLMMLIAARAGWPYQLIRAVTSLVAAWVVIRLAVNLVRDPVWSKVVAIVAWTLAALNILGLLDEATAALDSLAFSVGKVHVSILGICKAGLLLALLLWLANRLSVVVEQRLAGLPRLTPSAQLLFGKLLKISLFVVAVLVALGSVGIDITALAVFTGAVGVGVGFGMQSLVSNFVAGIILLVERSLKIGDFVEIASGSRGVVREINIRNTVITTNDNIDIIVPNSEFVNGTVTNWTFGDAYRRMRIPFGVAYGVDKELVRKAGLEAAAAVEHTLNNHPKREPQVWLVEFGESSLNFELVVWLTAEAVKRPSAVNAAYCWALHSTLAKYAIEIPFPQRDLHIRSGPPGFSSGRGELALDGVGDKRSAIP